MATNVCMKDIKEADWLFFKSEAVKANKTMGDFFSVVLSGYKRKPKSSWDVVLDWKPTMTPEEADEMWAEIKDSFRKETEFR